jgi:hypothetical protein
MTDPSDSCLIITGMHRSNTSFLAKSFLESGLHIGDQLVPANQFNQEGHFEDQEFVSFHVQLIQKYNLKSWRSIIDYNRCSTVRLVQRDVARAERLIQDRWTRRNLFGWKDPRTCHFLPLWKEIIPQAKMIFIIRDPEAVVSSLLRRYRQNNGRSFRPDLWYRYHQFWQITHQQIIDACERYPDDVHLIFTPGDISKPKCSAELNNKLSNYWRIDLRPIDLSTGYRMELITSSTDKIQSKSNKTSIDIYQKLKNLNLRSV